ncbi:MAG: hypothetical protein RR472_07565, partial [Anaerovoracaceae bacterium]
MDSNIKMMVDSYLDVFNTYAIADQDLAREVEELKGKVVHLGETIGDMAEFVLAFQSGGLNEQYTALLTKVAMATYDSGQASANTTEDTVEDGDKMPAKPPTVEEFLNQYRIPYEEVKKAGYRKRGEKAYETLFAVGDQTKDILDAQIIIEKDKLLWEIVRQDSLDIFETILEAMDPLNQWINSQLRLEVAAYKEAKAHEDLSYLLEKNLNQAMGIVEQEGTKVRMIAALGFKLFEFWKCRHVIWQWDKDSLVKSHIEYILQLRTQIKKILHIMEYTTGMKMEEVWSNPALKIWFLVPQALDGLSRIRQTLDPQNYKAFRYILEEEVLSDKPMEEILLS